MQFHSGIPQAIDCKRSTAGEQWKVDRLSEIAVKERSILR
jgi:hypothetical protein